MIIYLSQGTQTTQNTQMNADFFFCHAERSEASPARTERFFAALRMTRGDEMDLGEVLLKIREIRVVRA